MSDIQKNFQNDDNLELFELIRKIFDHKKFIIKTSFLLSILGVIYSITLPDQFTSSTTFIPQLSSDSKATSSLGGLASLAGINLGGIDNSSEFPPTLYPQVVGSVPFRLELLSSVIKFENRDITLREYFTLNYSSNNFLDYLKKYTIGLPSLLFSSLKTDENLNTLTSIYPITQEDQKLFKKLSSVFSLSINEKEGFITMSFTDKNRHISAQVTQISQTLLQEKIIEYKIQSSKELLDFTLNQYKRKKSDFELLQDERAIFVDKNINISSSLYQNKLSRIESELSIAQTVVQQLASQVEQAKLKVNKDTPVFTTIKPVSIPFEKSQPSRVFIVLSFFILGATFSISFVVFKDQLIELYNQIFT